MNNGLLKLCPNCQQEMETEYPIYSMGVSVCASCYEKIIELMAEEGNYRTNLGTHKEKKERWQ